jgi:hypothetical protein
MKRFILSHAAGIMLSVGLVALMVLGATAKLDAPIQDAPIQDAPIQNTLTQDALLPESPARGAQVITLPIEVMHPDVRTVGGRHTVATTVSVDDPTGIDRLWIQAHNLSYPEKASVRLNGGTWIDLNNETATCAHPEASYECIAGAYATIRFTVPVAGVRQGDNTVEFAFNGTDGTSTGYRILRFDFLPQSFSGNPTVKAVEAAGRIASSFAFEDPATWTAPRPAAADIAAGQQLWAARNRLVSEPGGHPIWAACADCHTSDGRDLQYFAYSNESIQVRRRGG